MNKIQIYYKLLKYVDITKWGVTTDGTYKFLVNNTYDNNNIVSFQSKNLGWFFKIKRYYDYGSYSTSNNYNDNFSTLVTLNSWGKFVFILAFFVITSILYFIFLQDKLSLSIYQFIFLDLFTGLILSYFFISIFRWRIYLKLRQAIYYINNEDKRRKDAEHERLNQHIIDIINSKNPQALRKDKLKKIGS